ncbi:MAG: 1-acyl-sn-glycerol-3-phosphate acyltransferase, partial [Microthrixaceae bacterium]
MSETLSMPTAGSWRHHPVQLRLIDAIAAVTWREVSAGDLAPTEEGPFLLFSNRFGGAADAIVLMSVLPRRPRILADDTIWRYPVARQVMEWLGAIPVHRGRSAKGGEAHSGSDNTDMFSSCHEALAEGDSMLIFPEGITREEPSIGEVKTGAARIALGALDSGVRGLRIVPVGIHYDDKAAFRSSVYVRRGEPIDLDDLVEEAGAQSVVSDEVPTEREAVEQLTALIDERLRASAPNYDDWREARSLQSASEAFLRTLAPDRSVPIGLRDRLASWLAADDGHESVEESAAEYRAALEQNGLDDGWAVEGKGGLRWRSVGKVLTWFLMLPYALAGIVAHAIPLALTWLVTKLKLAPAVMATVMPVAAAIIFGLTWCFWGWFGWRIDGIDGVISFLVLFPISFGALVLVAERAALWWRGLRNKLYGVRRGRRAGLSELRADTVQGVADLVNAELVASNAADDSG